MKIGCISLIPIGPDYPIEGRFVALDCSKGRGIICPGGKREKGETYKECAARELYEETHYHARELRYMMNCVNVDDYQVFAFHVTVWEGCYDLIGTETREGTWQRGPIC